MPKNDIADGACDAIADALKCNKTCTLPALDIYKEIQ